VTAITPELDRVYFDLLRIGLEHPELVDFPTTHDRSKARQYDAYAFMIWNFVETVFDRCQGWGWSKRRLRDTWYPVIAAENARQPGLVQPPAEPQQVQGTLLPIHRRALPYAPAR